MRLKTQRNRMKKTLLLDGEGGVKKCTHLLSGDNLLMGHKGKKGGKEEGRKREH